jgi:putative copper export protein
MFLAANGAKIILWIHILAASLWIGGQVIIALLIPLLRSQPALLATAARRYQQVAWTAYIVLIGTGLLNAHNAGITWSDLLHSALGRTLLLKLGFVALSGLAAAIHAFVVAPRAGSSGPTTRLLSAVLGMLSLGAALAAALYGVLIAEA